MEQVQVLYDFHAEPGSSEIDIVTGEILTVTRKDVGEGWWEGTNSSGQTGLFPADYVEEFKPILNVSKPPGIPPPPLPQQQVYMNSEEALGQNYESVDLWDSDWEDDSESGNHPPPGYPPTALPKIPSSGDNISVGVGDGKGTVSKRNISRFSSFVKSSWDMYTLGNQILAVPDGERIVVAESDNGVKWQPNHEPYLCIVASPKKESKFKGIKSFIAYQITPTFNNIQVSRRYKHFDWLHERLEQKFGMIAIPPLPDKQISGRYEDQFIEHRKNQLQTFVDYVCRHPVLSRSAVWQHFITCTDDKRWKAGKRQAEKDMFLGANMFFCIQSPEISINQFNLEQETESCTRFLHSIDSAMKNLVVVAADQSKKCQSMYKREYQKIGQVIYAFGQAMGQEEQTGADRSRLRDSLKKTGDTYNELGKLFEEQPKHDWEPLGDILHIYKGVVSNLPDILAIHKDTLIKKREFEKMTQENRVEPSRLQEALKRTDNVSYAVLAEINHFHDEQVSQINKAMKHFLTEQIKFHQKIVAQLQEALQSYN